MRQGNVFLGFCAALLAMASVAYAQTEGVRPKPLADYFAAVEETPAGTMIIKDGEHRRLQQAQLSLRQGQFSAAFRQCAQVLDRVVNHPQGLAILGMAAKLMKEPSLPIPYYERAIQRYPRRALTQAQYGKYLVSIGKVSDGIARLNRAIAIDAQLTVAYTWLAQVYLQNKQPELAQQVLQRRKGIEATAGSAPTETSNAQAEQNLGGEGSALGVFSDSVDGGGWGADEKKTGESPLSEENKEESPLDQWQER
jgi:Tfp pilus assembly protein PilF